MARIVVDIDGVLCEETGRPDDYADRAPLQRGIAMVRKLKADGHEVVLHTARWEEDREVTEAWMREHEVEYDALVLGKPRGDLYIDDRALRWPCSPGDLWRAVHTGGGPVGTLPAAAQARGAARLHTPRGAIPTAADLDPTGTPGDPTRRD